MAMKYELHAQFPFALKDSATQAFAISVLVGKRKEHPSWKEIQQLQNTFEGINILAQSIVTPYKEQARMGTRREVGGYRYWIKYEANNFLNNQLKFMNQLGSELSLPDISLFPPGSWAIQARFTLRKPYLSKDDVDFYIIDNPVKKEWVFKVPYVAASQWKGALRAAIIRELASQLQSGEIDEKTFINKRLQLYRLFGNEKDGTAEFLNRIWADYRIKQNSTDAEVSLKNEIQKVEKEFEAKLKDKKLKVDNVEGFQGRLHFYPTFFDRIGLEVINPHDRKTGTGKQPIYFECVPAGTKGIFTLLYVPLDTGPREEATSRADLETVARGIRAMLTEYGFGAKTSSGYGVGDLNKKQSLVLPREIEGSFWQALEAKDV